MVALFGATGFHFKQQELLLLQLESERAKQIALEKLEHEHEMEREKISQGLENLN